MRPNTLVLFLGLLAAPLALFANPQTTAMADGLVQMVQLTTGGPGTTTAPQETINGRPLEPAPTGGPMPGVSPVDRAAGPGSRSLTAGPINATPFSAGPTSAVQSGSPASPNGTPGGDSTPNLGK